MESQPDFVYDETGKITGYKTKAGADTVFPFKSGYTVSDLKTFTSGTLKSAQTWVDTGFSGDVNKIIATYGQFSGTVNGNTRSAYGANVFDSEGNTIQLNAYVIFKVENDKLYVKQQETAGSIPGYVKVCYTE